MKGKNIFASSRKLRRKRFIKKLVLVFLFLFFVFFCAVAFFYIPYLRIQKISIEGNLSLSTEKILAEISSYLVGKSFLVFPRNNIFILPKQAIINNLSNKFPRISEAYLNKDFPSSLSVVIKERKQAAILCALEDCFFIDENGFVFERAPYFSGDVYLKFLDEREETRNLASNWKQGFQLISEDQFKKLIDFRDLISRENIKVSEIILKKEGIYEMDISEGGHILLNEQNDAKISFENLKITLDSKIQNDRQKLEYIDLRFGNKVFYKFK